MKKKITAFLVAALMLFGITSMAEENTLSVDTATHRAVLLIYNADNTLVYVKTLQAENGVFDYGVVPQSYGTKRKLYFIDTAEITEVQSPDGLVPEDTTVPDPVAEVTEPAATEVPEETAAPTEAPAATAKPTATPKATTAPAQSLEGTPYEEAVDAIYAPALITAIAETRDSKDDEAYALTVMYQGQEMTVYVAKDLEISTAPDEYSSLVGKTAGSLLKGDVVLMTANIAGTKIKTLDLLFRPTADDIATGETNYGTSFEKLFSANGITAGKWNTAKYGSKIKGDAYAFGIVAKSSGGVLTLINKSGVTNDALEIDMSKNAYVYVCDVSGKEYNFDLGGTGDIETSLSSSLLNEDTYTLNSEDSYNYALVRIVDGTATEIIEYTNYND